MNRQEKGAVMIKKSVNHPKKVSEPITRGTTRGSRVVELLFASTTLGAAVLVAAMHGPKLPIWQGD